MKKVFFIFVFIFLLTFVSSYNFVKDANLDAYINSVSIYHNNNLLFSVKKGETIDLPYDLEYEFRIEIPYFVKNRGKAYFVLSTPFGDKNISFKAIENNHEDLAWESFRKVRLDINTTKLEFYVKGDTFAANNYFYFNLKTDKNKLDNNVNIVEDIKENKNENKVILQKIIPKKTNFWKIFLVVLLLLLLILVIAYVMLCAYSFFNDKICFWKRFFRNKSNHNNKHYDVLEHKLKWINIKKKETYRRHTKKFRYRR